MTMPSRETWPLMTVGVFFDKRTVFLFFECLLSYTIAVDTLKSKVTRKKGRGFGGMQNRGEKKMVCFIWRYPYH